MKQQGHTLMELMVVIAVMGITSALALPNFLTINSSEQVRSATEEIASELRLARQLAMTHRDRVRITCLAVRQWFGDHTPSCVSLWGQRDCH
jgi:type IV fimbrial biogenesis protein FimT